MGAEPLRETLHFFSERIVRVPEKSSRGTLILVDQSNEGFHEFARFLVGSDLFGKSDKSLVEKQITLERYLELSGEPKVESGNFHDSREEAIDRLYLEVRIRIENLIDEIFGADSNFLFRQRNKLTKLCERFFIAEGCVLQNMEHALLHFQRRIVCKGDGEDVLKLSMRDPVGKKKLQIPQRQRVRFP